MVDKVLKENVSLSYYQSQFDALGNGGDWISRSEVDANRDGFLDCSHYRDPEQFAVWQHALYRVGLISRIYPTNDCGQIPQKIEYDYVVAIGGNNPKIYAYFSDPAQAARFSQSTGAPLKETVNASTIERTDDMPYDILHPRDGLPHNFGRQINNVNRPPAGTSHTGTYTKVDLTPILNLDKATLGQINQTNSDTNCFNAALRSTGVMKQIEYTDIEDFEKILRQSFRRVNDDPKPGDLIVLKKCGRVTEAIHTFVDLGGGWGLTLNGHHDNIPFRVQRIERIRYLYEMYMTNDQMNKLTSGPCSANSNSRLKEVRYRSN